MKSKRKKSLRKPKFRRGYNECRLASMNPAYDKEEAHRPLHKNDIHGLDHDRIDAMLEAISISMSRMQPDGRHGLWSVLKRNQQMLLSEKWETRIRP